MKRALAYQTVSGKVHVRGDRVLRRLSAIREYASGHGVRIVNVFREEGVLGTKGAKDRPALAAMREALHAFGVKLLLIEKLDRLARDLMIQETIIGDMRKYGFELVSEPDLL